MQMKDKRDVMKKVIAVVSVLLAGDLILLVGLMAKSKDLPKAESTTRYIVIDSGLEGASAQKEQQGEYVIPNDGQKTEENGEIKTTEPTKLNNDISSAPKTSAPTAPQASSSAVLNNDPKLWNRALILKKTAEAVNKTKAYTGALTVNHKESFTADVTECTGGNLVKSVANSMIGWVVKPADEVLEFNGGTAKNYEGETVPILLPKRGNFTLNESGVKSASASSDGGGFSVKITLIEESVGITEIPVNYAAAVGYLDVGSFDLSLFTVDRADIIYKGSTIELHVNSQGYVTSAIYTIPMNVSGSVHRGSLGGSAVFDGEQTEIWQLNW